MKQQTNVLNTTETFIAAAISENHNSFGLKQAFLIAKDGTTFKACANDLNIPKRGQKVEIPVTIKAEEGKPLHKDYNFAAKGFEIPEKIENAPDPVIAEVWKF